MFGRRRRGVTLTEMVALLLVLTVVLCLTTSALSQQRRNAQRITSQQNLRQLGVATATYAAEWSDRQFTLVRDDLAARGHDVATALAAYPAGKRHPSIDLGLMANGQRATRSMEDPANHDLLMPITFTPAPRGWFRLVNAHGFNQYLTGRFYDRVFYAPEDAVPRRLVEPWFDDPAEAPPVVEERIWFSSYCFSPAALYSPEVLSSRGFAAPFTVASAFRSPAMSQALYPQLKTHVIEHHWLRGRPVWAEPCNAGSTLGTYDGCEPHYFNHYAGSVPETLFYDGHIEPLATTDALLDDARMRAQTGEPNGLWHRQPGGATDGYFESQAVDPTRASHHLFTRDGIRGRDMLMNRTAGTGATVQVDARQWRALQQALQQLEGDVARLRAALTPPGEQVPPPHSPPAPPTSRPGGR